MFDPPSRRGDLEAIAAQSTPAPDLNEFKPEAVAAKLARLFHQLSATPSTDAA